MTVIRNVPVDFTPPAAVGLASAIGDVRALSGARGDSPAREDANVHEYKAERGTQ